MGMHIYDINLIQQGINSLNLDSNNECNMAELGNQRIRGLQDYWEPVEWDGLENGLIKGSAKYYYSNLGINHSSFDLNGKDAAIPLDLCKPLDKKYVNKYNLVTNIGTTEHTEDQYQVFNNIDKFCCKGGVMVHNIPAVNNWRGHANAWYTTDFFRELAKLYDYEVIIIGVNQRTGTINNEDYNDCEKETITTGLVEFIYSMTTNHLKNKWFNKAQYKENNFVLTIDNKELIDSIIKEKSLTVSSSDLTKFINFLQNNINIHYEKTQVDGSKKNNISAILRKNTNGVFVSREDFSTCEKLIRKKLG